MHILKLDHVGIRVMDLEASIRFYEKLDFVVTRKDHEEHVFVIKHQSGVELNLLDNGQDDNKGRNILMDIDIQYPGYTHYAIEVKSVIEAKNYIESKGVKITEGPVTFGDGKTSIFVRDPDMSVIEFTELPKH